MTHVYIVNPDYGSNAFTRFDRKLFESNTWKNKIENILDKSQVQMNIVLIKKIDEIAIWNTRNRNFDQAYQYLHDQKIEIENQESRINVFMGSNNGGNQLPFTPWITLHRACHAIQFRSKCVVFDDLRNLKNYFLILYRKYQKHINNLSWTIQSQNQYAFYMILFLPTENCKCLSISR